MIVVIGGIKGGSGKTTIATNLAVMRSTDRNVLLVDADEQRSAWDWWQQRLDRLNKIKDFCENDLGIMCPEDNIATICLSGKTIYSKLLKLKKDYDDIIVDTAGRDTTSQRSALCVANKLILPFKPSSVDIWTLVTIKEILQECVNINLKAYAIINQADSIGSDNDEAIEILKECREIYTLETTIGNRKAFRNALGSGLGVDEGDKIDKKARQEMQSLYDIIYR